MKNLKDGTSFVGNSSAAFSSTPPAVLMGSVSDPISSLCFFLPVSLKCLYFILTMILNFLFENTH